MKVTNQGQVPRMDWLMKIAVIWISLDIVIIASAWYAITTIKPLYPNWWRRVIVDDDPERYGFDKRKCL